MHKSIFIHTLCYINKSMEVIAAERFSLTNSDLSDALGGVEGTIRVFMMNRHGAVKVIQPHRIEINPVVVGMY